jgi:hypothetical protein
VGIDQITSLSFRCTLMPPWAEARTRPAAVEDAIINSCVRHIRCTDVPGASSDLDGSATNHGWTAGVAAVGPMMCLPQEVGLFGATLVAHRTGTLRLAAFYHHSDVDIATAPAVVCDEVITVEPSTVDWEKSRMMVCNAAQTAPLVVGQTLTFGLVLYDVFGNLVSPLQEEGRDDRRSGQGRHSPQEKQQPRYDGVTTRAVLLGESVSAPRGNESQRNNDKGEEGRSSQDSLAGDHDDQQQHHDLDDVDVHNAAAQGRSGGTSTSASGRRVEEFEQQELPLLKMVCDNNNHNDPHAVLCRHPEERRHTSLVPKVQVRPEWIAPSTQLALAPEDLHCSVFFHVAPTVAGVCHLRLVHRDSEIVLSAAAENIVTGPVVSGELLPPVPSTVRAGDVAVYHLKLRDEFSNWIVVDPAAAAGAAQQSIPLQKQLKLCVAATPATAAHNTPTSTIESTDHPGTTWTITQDDTALALHVTATIAETLIMRIVLADTASRQIAVLPPLCVTPAPMHAPRCKWTLYSALPSVEQLQRPTSLPGSVSVAAGEALYASLAAFDRFGNVIVDALQELSLDCGGTACRTPISSVVGTNGTSRPPVSVVAPLAATTEQHDAVPPTSHQIVYSLTPSERSSVILSVTTACDTSAASVLTSDVVAVLPAPLHWPSCTVRLSDELIVLGSSTNVIVQLRDRFLNPVEAASAAFRVVVAHGPATNAVRYLVGPNPAHHHGLENDAPPLPPDFEELAALPVLPDCEGFSSTKGKTLLCEVKPVQRGDLLCEVYYLPTLVDGSQSPHITPAEAVKSTGTSQVQ